MKIERKTGKSVRETQKRDNPGARFVDSDAFSAELRQVTQQLSEQELTRMFDRLSELGDALVQVPSMEAVNKYRKSVKALVEYIVRSGLRVKSDMAPDARGKRKLYLVLEEIDEKLMELVKTTMLTQKDPLQILGIVGEIKGLLISLRT